MKKTHFMKQKENNYAFVDSQNLNLSIRSLGWRVDYRRFRIYLQENMAFKRHSFFSDISKGILHSTLLFKKPDSFSFLNLRSYTKTARRKEIAMPNSSCMQWWSMGIMRRRSSSPVTEIFIVW